MGLYDVSSPVLDGVRRALLQVFPTGRFKALYGARDDADRTDSNVLIVEYNKAGVLTASGTVDDVQRVVKEFLDETPLYHRFKRIELVEVMSPTEKRAARVEVLRREAEAVLSELRGLIAGGAGDDVLVDVLVRFKG